MTDYATDYVLWAKEQAEILRTGDLSRLDRVHAADEIESLALTARREFRRMVSILLSQLLMYAAGDIAQRRSIDASRAGIAYELKEAPSLRSYIESPSVAELIWANGIALVPDSIEVPEAMPWTLAAALESGFYAGQ
ncbi:DUF29 family protein [Paraburkholderia fungorum]|uniref:DUF29 family protein n=1 Tax=Paraburkholderia fungorum TaxID=134537 RepID=UPI0038B8EB43